MAPSVRQYSRLKATVAGSLAGVAVGGGTVIALLTHVADSTPHYQNVGLSGFAMVVKLLPGSLLIGTVLAFPTVAAMVRSLVTTGRRWPGFDSTWVWTTAGLAFTSPTAYLFSMLQDGDDQFALLSIWTLTLVAGAVAGLFAWMFHHRPASAVL